MHEVRDITNRRNTPLVQNWPIDNHGEHPENQIDKLRTRARVTLSNDIGAEEHHRARFALGQSVTNTRGVTAHEIHLQGSQFLRWYRDLGEFSESGCDAVYD